MAGLAIVIPRNGPGTGPVIPTPLHSAGVSGYSRRFVASRIEAAVGASVASWADFGSAGVALTKGGTGTATVQEVQSTRVVRLDSTGGIVSSLSGGATTAAPRTIALVMRTSFLNQSFASYSGATLFRAAITSYRQAQGSAAATTWFQNANGGTDLVCVIAQVDTTDTADAPSIRVNAAESFTVTGTFALGTVAPLSLLAPVAAASTVDFAEVTVWDRALSSVERVSVYDAMRAHYAALPQG